MASTIKVDNVQNQPGTNIVSKCGTDVTIGASGDTVALASGASQTGFGRTGTVDWDTASIKTTGFTAVSGNGYFCDTADSGAFTLTLPTSPSAGDIVGMKDYNGNFATANLTIGRGGSKINGADAGDVVIQTAGAAIFLVYVDATQGWVATQDDESVFSGQSFMCASVSGACNTLTDDGNCKVATFKGPGTFTVSSIASCLANNLISYMVVAGGGGSAKNAPGGGGAGGYRETKSPSTPYTASPLDGYATPGNRITVTATAYPIAVGGGGAGSSSGPTAGCSGGVSTFSTICSAGGGGGGGWPSNCGVAGGSGGGARSNQGGLGGAGNTPPTTPAQGFAGGTSQAPPGCAPPYIGGGGGGATTVGSPGNPGDGGGGTGATTGISGASVAYSGGGGGGSNDTPGIAAGPPGLGGGGAGGESNQSGCAGTVNTGGGAGGSGSSYCPNGGNSGGSGIVIIRYKYQ